MGIFLRTKTKTAILEVRFKDRLDDELHRHLRYSVSNGGYPQRPVSSITLGNKDSPYGSRSVGLLFKFLLKRREKFCFALASLNRLKSHPVDAWGSSVCSNQVISVL